MRLCPSITAPTNTPSDLTWTLKVKVGFQIRKPTMTWTPKPPRILRSMTGFHTLKDGFQIRKIRLNDTDLNGIWQYPPLSLAKRESLSLKVTCGDPTAKALFRQVAYRAGQVSKAAVKWTVRAGSR